MKILVTGCSGYVGKKVLHHLVARGFAVRGLDLVDPHIDQVDFRQADLLETSSLTSHLAGVDAILHLAGIPAPGRASPEAIFSLNCTGTFKIYTAAAAAGISRVVVASSINSIGFFFGTQPFEPSTLPIDEQHPKFTTDAYSFSKQVTEDIADYFWRRDGISGASLRFGAGWPHPASTRKAEVEAYRQAREHAHALAARPADELAAWLEQAQAQFHDLQRQRFFEKSQDTPEILASTDLKLMWMRHTFFSYVDLVESCRAMELALTANFEGSHPLFVVHPENIIRLDARALARIFFPQVKNQDRLQGMQSLLSGQRAEKLIGFRAQVSPDNLLIE